MLNYGLVVARGYVRLVRRGERPSRRVMYASFVRRGGQWVERDGNRSDALEEADAHEDFRSRDADALWTDGPQEPDPFLEAAMDEALHPRRGDAGQSARSRMNMRRLFVSLPWELVGPRPALISLTYPGLWQPWVPDGRVWETHRRAIGRRWVRRLGVSLSSVSGSRSSRPADDPTCTSTSAFQRRWRPRTLPAYPSGPLQRHRLARSGRHQLLDAARLLEGPPPRNLCRTRARLEETDHRVTHARCPDHAMPVAGAVYGQRRSPARYPRTIL
jgi:hypothetical protein